MATKEADKGRDKGFKRIISGFNASMFEARYATCSSDVYTMPPLVLLYLSSSTRDDLEKSNIDNSRTNTITSRMIGYRSFSNADDSEFKLSRFLLL